MELDKEYFLEIPLGSGKLLFIFWDFNINNLHSSWNFVVSYLTKIHDIFKLFYYAYTGTDGPDWEIDIRHLNNGRQEHTKYSNISKIDFASTYKNGQALMDSIKTLNKDTISQQLKNETYWNVVGNVFTKKYYLRGQKDVLISMVTELCHTVIDAGLPPDNALALLDELIQKIELQKELPPFNLYMQTLIWRYYLELKMFRDDRKLPIAERCMFYIQAKVNEKITLTEISQHFNYSTALICRKFKAKYHKSIVKAIQEEKIKEATELLSKSSYSISEICRHLGFNSVSYFYRVFKKETGMTPNEYRKCF